MQNIIDFEKKKARKDFDNMYDKFVEADENDLLTFMHLTDEADNFLITKVLKIKANDSQYFDKLAKNKIHCLISDAQEAYLKKYVF